jgi:hypothetical protein
MVPGAQKTAPAQTSQKSARCLNAKVIAPALMFPNATSAVSSAMMSARTWMLLKPKGGGFPRMRSESCHDGVD